MRTLFVCALAATLVGCSCFVSPQTGIEACSGTSGWFACVDRTALVQAAEPDVASFDTTPAKPRTKSKVAARTEKSGYFQPTSIREVGNLSSDGRVGAVGVGRGKDQSQSEG